MNVLRYECKVTEKENSVILSYRAYAEEDKRDVLKTEQMIDFFINGISPLA